MKYAKCMLCETSQVKCRQSDLLGEFWFTVEIKSWKDNLLDMKVDCEDMNDDFSFAHVLVVVIC